MKKILPLLMFTIVTFGCGIMRNSSTGETISLTGKINKLGITTYQYGTHVINANGKPFALKSAAVLLDTYIDKQVTITGIKVPGYPLSGGPDLIEVTEVIMK
ncbi:hypothetical protein [Pedobacter sandarakinus]|uniref:hypothetical protein n=1 Tax=Pedobacter sandarakinus TaxID=353156 RepID=UPI002245BB79|nr:hypothetical protein [Pedobacter sandarakinus]MCX2574812.1 hypothetical protein [Pedobacter sandarakinus]